MVPANDLQPVCIKANQHLAIANCKRRADLCDVGVNFFQLLSNCVRMLCGSLKFSRAAVNAGHDKTSSLMTISVSGRQRVRFRTDLLAHREAFSLNDAEYADQVLKVSLNTYKKCVQVVGHGALALKRHTFVSIFTHTALDPKNYGLSIGVPSQISPFGGYQKDEFSFLCGRFFLYRRTFLTARHVTRSILEIRPSESQECLSFKELHYYTAEVGVREEIRYQGDVYMNQERTILSMPAYSQGQVRLTLLQPERLSSKGKLKMRGAVLAFGNPKGYWQPTVACVFVDGPIQDKRSDPRDLCKTIMDSSEEYAPLSAELARVEEHGTIMTPLMWSNLHPRTRTG